jgi:hypothetical protein
MNKPPGWGPGHPEYEAKMAADIAKLQGAKGIQLRAWARENKLLLIVFAVYLSLVVAAGFVWGPAASLIAVFWVPIAGFRIYLRHSRR